jgi:PAS domain S-box-containing protein
MLPRVGSGYAQEQEGARSRDISSDRLGYWRAVIEAFPDGVCITDTSGVHLEVNSALCQMTGYSRAELVGGAAPFPYWAVEGMGAIRLAFERTLRGECDDFELLFCRKNGERFPVLVHPSEVTGADGTALFYLATVKDISERKRMEVELLRSEQLWRSIAENPFDFVVVIGRDYKYQFANHMFRGVCPEDLIGNATPFDFVDPAYHATMRAAFDTAFRDGVATSYDVFVPQLNRWLGSVVGPIFEHGCVSSISILTRDVTDKKRAEESLRQSEHRLQLALAGGDVGAFDVNVATGDLFCSARLAALLGHADGDPALPTKIGQLRARLHPDDADATLRALGHALDSDDAFDAEFRLSTAAGEYRWFHGRGRVFRESAPATGIAGVNHFSGFLTDVTARRTEAEQRRQLEADLRHAQKLETLGTLAGGIAHDFNNLLVPIVSNAQVALRRLAPSNTAYARLEEILKAATRARELVKRIVVFGRRADEPHEPIHLPDLVREVLSLLEASMPPGVQLSARIAGDCPLVMGDPNQIHQALTNVGMNAFQALGSRPGNVVVTVETLAQATADACGRATPAPARVVRISIQDDGPGIPAAILERVFEPFFTTKGVGEGSGLGLAMVHAIVTQHGGTVTAHSEPGQGALFQLCFPVPDSVPAAAPLGADAGEQAAVTTLRILCVDDEPTVVLALAALLECGGHTVTALTSPTEALRRVRAEPDAFDLVITDLTMPEMRGVDLAQRLAELRRDLPVILITGYGDVVQRDADSNVRLCLGKPVDIDDLLGSIDKVAAERRA